MTLHPGLGKYVVNLQAMVACLIDDIHSIAVELVARLSHIRKNFRKVNSNNRDEDGVMGNGSEPVRTPEK